MTPLAQALPALAMVIGFAMPGIRQVRLAAALLAIQSAATAVAAIAVRQPLLALPPLILAALVWVAPGRVIAPQPSTLPIGGIKPALVAGATLIVLSQSLGALALPLCVSMLGILLAATRRGSWMRVMALVQMQNGVVLAACITEGASPLLVMACCALPLPLPLLLLLPLPLGIGLMARRREGRPGPDRWSVARDWLPYLDLAASMAVLAATVLVPLSPLSSAFAPLLGLDAVFQSYARRNKTSLPPRTRILAFFTAALVVAAACASQPIMVWLAVLAASGTHFARAPTRRPDDALLAFTGAGVLLFGLLTLGPPFAIVGYFCIFAGIVAVCAVVPDLAVPLIVLLLRLAIRTPWPAAVSGLGLAIALSALAVCAVGLARRRSIAALYLAQTSTAAIALCLGTPDGRFAALALLTLLILTRTATRVAPVTPLANAALAGGPPLGVFPGLVLVTLALAGQNPWLLLPVGAAFVPILLSIRPGPISVHPSLAWLPFGLALLAGYGAPDGLIRWWHMLTAGQG